MTGADVSPELTSESWGTTASVSTLTTRLILTTQVTLNFIMNMYPF